MGDDRPRLIRFTRWRLIRFTRWVGLALVAGGFVVIAVGWNQVAQLTCVDCQLPYVLSAGGAGIGLVILGVGLLLIAQLRVEGARMVDAIRDLNAASTETDGGGPPIDRDEHADNREDADEHADNRGPVIAARSRPGDS